MKRFKYLSVLILSLLVISLVITSPILSSERPEESGSSAVYDGQGRGNGNGGGNGGGNGNGNGNGGGRGNGNGGQPAIVVEQPPVSEPTAQPLDSESELLGCQKNNPERLDCSSLSVSGVCDGDSAVFTITNTGEPGNGDMRAATQYRLIVDGVVVQTGTVQLAGGQTMTITYAGGGTVTLEVDQQVGHPGNSRPQTTLTCSAPPATSTPVPTTEVPPTALPTDEPTPEVTPTAEPTHEVTPEPTDEVTPPDLYVEPICWPDATAFIVGNNGGDMTEPISYQVIHETNGIVDQGTLQLLAGQATTLVYPFAQFGTPLTLVIGDWVIYAVIDCGVDPTPETPVLYADPYCLADGSVSFVIINEGADMTEAASYIVVDSGGNMIDQGTVFLLSWESITLTYPAGLGTLTIVVGDWLAYSSIDCAATTPEPTPEVTPTDEVTPEPTPEVTPTDEVTPEPTPEVTPTDEVTPEPTPEVTPTDEVTPEPTPEVTPTPVTSTPVPTDPLGCQKNNPARLDCSSLQVTATCDGDVAVFTITNTGNPGDGDMRAPTEYRIIVDGVVVYSGTVQIGGGESLNVTYANGGTVTLEADQQIGHPGKSQPQATVSCG